jgi:predicted PurR-regulated permease PerM
MMFVNLTAAIVLLYLGADIFLPIAVALVVTTVLRPVVKRMERARVPTPAGAAIVVISGLVVLWAAGYELTPAVTGFVKTLPDVATSAAAKLRTLPSPLDRLGVMMSATAAEMEKPSDVTDSTAIAHKAARARNQAAPATPVTGGLSSAVPIIGQVFGTAAGMVSGFMATLLLVLFFLASGDQVRKRLMKLAASSSLARSVVEIGDELQSVVARYLSLLTLINLGQGTAVAIVMTLIGMPVPLVWGAMSFVAEFFPYLGSAVMIILLTLVGLAGSSGLGHVILAPLAYVGVTMIQGSVISPITYGRFLKLSPPALLVSVMVWWLIWGVLGAFLAVPILALIRIVCDRQQGRLAVLGAFIEG